MWENIAWHKATGIVSAFIGDGCVPAPVMCGGRMWNNDLCQSAVLSLSKVLEKVEHKRCARDEGREERETGRQ